MAIEEVEDELRKEELPKPHLNRPWPRVTPVVIAPHDLSVSSIARSLAATVRPHAVKIRETIKARRVMLYAAFTAKRGSPPVGDIVDRGVVEAVTGSGSVVRPRFAR